MPLIHDPARCRLGKHLGVVRDPRTLRLASYLPATLPKAPSVVTNTRGIKTFPMFANDTAGDCTCAAPAHNVRVAAHANLHPDLTDQAVLAVYSAVTGYDPRRTRPDDSNPTDNGAYEVDILNYVARAGMGGHKPLAWVAVDSRNHEHVRLAAWLFGGVLIGAGLPVTAQRQKTWKVPTGQPLTGDWAPGSWGGHAMCIPDVAQSGVTAITWGEKKKIGWSWWDAYVDEAYAVIWPEWLRVKHGTTSPHGFNLPQLQADLDALRTS